jgi:uncharacterized membrane protein
MIVMLIAIGILSGIGRVLHPGDLGARVERFRATTAWQTTPPELQAMRQEETARAEARFARRPASIALHAGFGALFLLLAGLQFSERLRSRHVRLHRWNGRLLCALALVIAVTGLYFGVVIPAAGAHESVVIGVATALFLISLAKGVVAARKGHLTAHREWMIRAFAVAIGISTIRIAAAIFDATLNPRGWSLKDIFILSLVSGWSVTLCFAEVWIQRTRVSMNARVAASLVSR